MTYYNISKKTDEKNNKVNFSVTFDKDKIHDLFYKKGISYSDISDKEFYILPILSNDKEEFIFSNNYFYENWNKNSKDELIEFILPLENIEIIQNINKSRNNLLDIDLISLFKEYLNKNIAVIIIEESNSNEQKVYLKTRIQDKIISKSLKFKKNNLEKTDLNNKIIKETKDEIVNLVTNIYKLNRCKNTIIFKC